MSTAPEIPRMVTREMIEAHYKSVMNAARLLLSQGETIHAQDLLSEACSRPYPIPAPAAMPEAPSAHPARQEQTTAETARLFAAAPDLYEALARLLQHCPTYSEFDDPEEHLYGAALERARAALDTATGGTQ